MGIKLRTNVLNISLTINFMHKSFTELRTGTESLKVNVKGFHVFENDEGD